MFQTDILLAGYSSAKIDYDEEELDLLQRWDEEIRNPAAVLENPSSQEPGKYSLK